VAVLERLSPPVLGVFGGATNPESAELLPDGETVLFGNASVTVGVPWFREGKGLAYVRGAAFLSTGRIAPDGSVTLVSRTLVAGLTATLGCDVVRIGTRTFPEGTLLVACGGGPVATPAGEPAPACPEIVGVDPSTGAVLGRIALGPGSPAAGRYNPLAMPNGLAVGFDGTVYVSDMPNTNPDPDPHAPPPVPPAVYALPLDALDALAAGEPRAADAVQRIVMPGFVNGLAVSPLDGACLAASCSRTFDPVNGGVYALRPGDFSRGVQPEPTVRDLEPIDGIGMTRRGTLLASNPLTGRIHAITADGAHAELAADEWPVAMPADINVVYPTALGGEPALLVPDVSVGAPPGSGVVAVLDLTGL
jgi:hypothetical protein